MKPVGHPTEGTLIIGTSLFLIAVGAILKFAVTAHARSASSPPPIP